MDKVQNNSMYFETTSTTTKKHFKVSFPIDVILTMRWDKEEIEQLTKYDKSELVSDKLKMMAMYAKKLEDKEKDDE